MVAISVLLVVKTGMPPSFPTISPKGNNFRTKPSKLGSTFKALPEKFSMTTVSLDISLALSFPETLRPTL